MSKSNKVSTVSVEMATTELNTKKSSVSEKGADIDYTTSCARVGDDDNKLLRCCNNFQQNRWAKVFIFIIITALDIADTVSDWLLYQYVANTEKGLVYGPPMSGFRISLLVISIIGSILFTFEIVNFGKDTFKGPGWLDVDDVSALIIWVEDIPQIGLNVAIAACREEPIGYFQLVKASVIIFGAIIRIILYLIRYCSAQCLAEIHRHTLQSCRHVTARAFIVIGLLVMLAGSLTVFIFTQIHRESDGSLTFQVPNAFEGEMRDTRYFDNVSVFLQHPVFTKTHTPDDVFLVQMASIYDIRDVTKDTHYLFRLSSRNDGQDTLYGIADNHQLETKPVYRTCFKMTPNSTQTQPVTCAEVENGGTFTETVFLFTFTPEGDGFVFGDINYNVRQWTGTNGAAGKCSYPEALKESLPDTDPSTQESGMMRYFKIYPYITVKDHLKLTINGGTMFYKTTDLLDIAEVWRTGYSLCEPTGRLAPHYVKEIQINHNVFTNDCL